MKVVIPMSGHEPQVHGCWIYSTEISFIEIDGKTLSSNISLTCILKILSLSCILNRKHHDETDVAGSLTLQTP